MKSPFLVAAQLQASSSEFRGEYDGDDEVDSRTTPLKKRGAASTTSNGNGNGNGLLSPVPIPPSSAKTLPSSTGRKNGRPSSTPTTINGTTSKRKAVNSSDGRTVLQATPPPSLDQLPGSRLSSPSANGSALQQAPYTSGTTTTPAPSSLRAIATANAHANGKLAGIVPRARSVRALERQRKAKQRSNLILLASALPIAAVVLYDYLYPATAHLSTLHTRTPAWHLSSIPSKCLHLSYQIPSSTDALLNNLSSSSSSRPLSHSHNTISTLDLLRNALSTAPTTARFLKGPDDIFVVLLWISFFTCFRESLIRFVFAPIGRLGGLRKNGALLRFGEQGYDVASHTLAVLFGFCTMQAKDSGYRNLDIDGLWIGYPHYKLPGSLKFYYLMQEGFWLQQFLTIHLEKKRKDYRQMLTHHFITVSLLYLSYIYNFTRIGNVILILMDVSDIVLGIAKMQKYLGFENLCDVSFGLFMLSWIVTRHILYVRVLASVIWDSKKFIHFEWAPEKEYFWSENTKAVFVTLLSTLQILLILWFGMIVKVAVAVLRGKPAEDTRSDEDDASETTVDGRASGSSTPKRVSSNGNGHANGHAHANANGDSVKFTPNGNGNGHGNGHAVGNQNKVTSNGYHVNNGGMTSSRTTASSTPSTTGRKKKQT